MATQDPSSGIPLSYAPAENGLRLLELPPELCDLVTSNSLPRLWLKSASASPSNPSNGHAQSLPSYSATAPPHAVLCTPSRTYQLRQVQTSNTVLVVRPHLNTNEEDDGNSAGAQQQGLCAFATCSSSLEISPLDAGNPSNPKIRKPDQWLNAVLPLYEQSTAEHMDMDVDVEVDMHDNENSHPHKKGTGKGHISPIQAAIFSNVPYSDGECEAAWCALGAFEHATQGPVRPSVKALLHLRTSLFQSINVERPFTAKKVDGAIRDSGLPSALFRSVLKHLTSALPDSGPAADVDLDVPVQLVKDSTILWVGELYHASKVLTPPGAVPKATTAAEDLDGWRSLLPEAWSQDVMAEKFAELRLDRFVASGTTISDGHGVVPDIPVKKPGRNRDWHQKLKRTRTK